jgi:two-component system response regulator FixJ
MNDDRLVYVVEDDVQVRESMRALLVSAGFGFKGYGSATAFLAENIRAGGCLIADVRLPGISGLQLLEELVKRESLLRVIVVTGHADVALAVRAMKAGAVDFIEKPFDDDALLSSVQKALDRGRREQNRSEEVRAAHELIALLTPREREVLEQLVIGRSNKLAAYELSISPRTIEIHRARIMSKLRAGSLSDVVRMAIAASLPPLANM